MPDSKVIKALPTIVERLHAVHPDARYELDWENPLQLLVATILAAQCTDERVNQVTPGLFAKYPDAKAYAEADLAGLEEDLKPTGFYKQKAKTVQAVCRVLVERHGGEVPNTMEEMVELPGVARKTANVVLTNAFGLATGVIVDTHVQRVSQRMGLTDQKNPEKIELDLMRLVPKSEWIFFGPAMVLHGRYTCTFHAPRCSECTMKDLCPKVGVGDEAEGDSAPDEEAPDEEDSATMAAKKPAKKTKAAPTKKKASPARTEKPTPKAPPAPAAPSLKDGLPADWQAVLSAEFDKPYFKSLEKYLAQERATQTVYPPAEDVFNAFAATPFEQVKVVLLGQDPYHGPGEAHGMAFSVRPGIKVPPSLVNVYKEVQEDVGCKPPSHGFLQSWAQQGVLLLNTVLTVRANEAASHKEQGWEPFTDAVIKALAARKKPAVFLLWGSQAQKKKELIDTSKHRILESAHPSPLSAKKFFGSKPFSGTNKALQELGQPPINWQLPENPSDSAKPAPAAAPVAVPAKPVAAAAPAPVVKEEPTRLETLLPADWRAALAEECRKPYFKNLDKFLVGERRDGLILPDESNLFNALKLTPLASVRVVILGNEPPCAEGVADGLAFSVCEGVEPAETSRTIFRELRDDLGCRKPVTGSLEAWAKQGVLLLNSILTVRSGRPNSHKDKGWESFTDAILKRVNASKTPIVFALWGNAAAKKRSLIDEGRHVVLTTEHPAITPDKFVGSRMFTLINDALELNGRSGVYWQLRYV